MIRRVKRFLGFNSELPKKQQDFLDKDGDTKITSLKVVRAPIYEIVRQFLNVISLGLFNKLQQKVGYDKLYHLSLVVNNATRIEKNEQIKISPYRDMKDEQTMEVPLRGRDFTIKELMDNTSRVMGDKFLPYDAFENNCQDFIIGILRANSLSNPELEKFIKQPVGEIVDGLPGYVKTTTKAITTIGGLLTYLREEIGLKKGGVITPELFIDDDELMEYN